MAVGRRKAHPGLTAARRGMAMGRVGRSGRRRESSVPSWAAPLYGLMPPAVPRRDPGQEGHVALAISLQDLLPSRLGAQPTKVAHHGAPCAAPHEQAATPRSCVGAGALSTLPVLMVYTARMVFHPSLQHNPWGCSASF